MKLPALQFYPGDWRKDPGVQALDFFARGVWFEILCLMHESEKRGLLLLNGKAMPDDALAVVLGIPTDLLNLNLTKLLTYGVADRDETTGALMNRRMVRDEAIRKTRAKCGKMGGNPALLKLNPTSRPKVSLSDSQPLHEDEDEGSHVRKGGAGGKESCTLAEARAAGPRSGITEDEVEFWWLSRASDKWMKGAEGNRRPVGDQWQHDMKAFTNSVRKNGGSTNATNTHQQRHSGSLNAPGRYK